MQPRWLILLVFGLLLPSSFYFFLFSSSCQTPITRDDRNRRKKTTPEVTFVNPRRGAATTRNDC